MLVTTQALDLALLAALTETDGALFGAKIGLFKANVTLQPSTVLADLSEADFTGYARSAAITWGTPGVSSDKTPMVAGDAKVFTAGNPITVPNQIYGYFVCDAAGTGLLYAEKFANPLNVSQSLQQLRIVPTFSTTNQAT